MKRSLFALVNYILIFAFILANPVWAAQLNETQLHTQMVVSATALNVRSSPTTDGSKISTLNKNSIVTAVAVKDGWFKILLDSQYGWVHGDYVYTKDTDPAKKLITSNYAVVTVKVANMRSAVGADKPVVATLKEGDTGAVINTENDWVKIRLSDGKEGYVPSWHVKLAKLALSTTDKPAPNTSFKKATDRNDNPSRSDDRNEPPVDTPPVVSPPTPPSTGNQVVLNINGGSSSAQAQINQVEVAKNSNNLIIRVVTDKPVSFNDKQEDSKITVNVFDALGIASGKYDIFQGNVGSLEVFTSGNNTELTINATPEDTYTIQRVSGKSEFVITIPLTITSPNTGNGKLAGKLIVLDAGHGGLQSGSSDPGAIGPNKVQERDVVLEITKKTRDLLEAQGATVLMTREGDSTQLSLTGRAKLANDNNADIFVAIHANASTSPTLSGTSTYFYAPTSKPDLYAQRDARKSLAQSVQDSLVAKTNRRNIGILEANFAVLRETTVPSILVETAFISNPEEEILLANDLFRQHVAEGIANGLANYFAR